MNKSPCFSTCLIVLLASSVAVAGDETHWAFQPPKPQALPRVVDRSWAANPIDVFVAARLRARASVLLDGPIARP